MKIVYYTFLFFTLFACNSSSKEEQKTPTGEPTDSATQVVQKESSFVEDDANIALEFVNSYVKKVFNLSEETDIVAWSSVSSLVTKNFNFQLKKMITEAFEEEPDYGLGYDPILNGNDFPDDGFKLENFDTKTGRIRLQGIGKYGQERHKIDVQLIHQNGKVLIEGCGTVNMANE